MYNDKGFTLVEIAVVLLIASLLLAAVLQGESILRAARVQDAITLGQNIAAAVNSFKQRYHMFPGDFPIGAETEFASVSPACKTGAQKGDGNGLIDSGGNIPGALGVWAEVQCVPEVLFRAGIVSKVDTDVGTGLYVFNTRFGGHVWVKVVTSSLTVAAFVAAGNPSPFSAAVTHVIEYDNLPCSAAKDIDHQIDNGDLATGKGAASIPACVGDDPVSYAISL